MSPELSSSTIGDGTQGLIPLLGNNCIVTALEKLKAAAKLVQGKNKTKPTNLLLNRIHDVLEVQIIIVILNPSSNVIIQKFDCLESKRKTRFMGCTVGTESEKQVKVTSVTCEHKKLFFAFLREKN